MQKDTHEICMFTIYAHRYIDIICIFGVCIVCQIQASAYMHTYSMQVFT